MNLIIKHFVEDYSELEEPSDRFIRVIFMAFRASDMTPVGTGNLYWYIEQDDMEAVMSNLSVGAMYRGEGIGLKLQQAREEYAVKHIPGLTAVLLWVNEDSWMRTWYENRGYSVHKIKARTSPDSSDVWMTRPAGHIEEELRRRLTWEALQTAGI